MKHLSRNLALGLALLVVLLAIVLLPHSSSQRKLAHLKAELRARGEKLTLAELASRPATNHEQVIAREMFLSNSFALPDVAWPRPLFVGAGQVRGIWQNRTTTNAVFNGGTAKTNTDWELLDRLLAGQGTALEQLQQALQIPAPDAGWSQRDPLNMPKVDFVRVRTCAQYLAAAFVVDLHGARLEAAQKDLRSLISLAQVNRNLYLLVAQMIRANIAQIALDATWQALAAPGWTEATLAELQHHWEEVDLIEIRERSVVGELAADLDVFQRARTLSGRNFRRQILYEPWEQTSSRTLYYDLVVLPSYKAFSLDEDELFLIRSTTNILNDIRLLNRGTSWPEVNARLKQHAFAWDKELASVRLHRLILSARLMGNYARAMETMMQVETQRQLTITAIALQRYALLHAQPPPDLAALAPDFLPAPSLDPMDGKPLRYRLNPKGGYVLYSVGEDGVDNGGEAGFGLWAGRDAVWPVSAPATVDAPKKNP